MGLIPTSQTLNCRIVFASAAGSEGGTSGTRGFGRRFIRPDYCLSTRASRDTPHILMLSFLQANHAIAFDNVVLPEAAIVRAGGTSFDDGLAIARVVVAAYQVGGMLEMLEMSVNHSNTRVQFGTPIGRFQRVQDHIIRLLNAMDAAKWATYEAAWALETGRNGVARSYLAGSTASDSYFEAANAAHEVHAAIGSDPRYGLTLYTRISRTIYELLGPPGWQRRQMADALDW